MAKWAHSNLLDQGLNYLKTTCNLMGVVKAYTAGDSYATVTSNLLASVVMASTDFTLAGAAGVARTCTSATKTANASGAGLPGTSADVVFLDSVGSTVILVTTETSAQAIVSGNPITWPPVIYTANQPG